MFTARPRRRFLRAALPVLFVWLIANHARADALEATAPDFDKGIAPLLVRRCLSCHGGVHPKAKLDLSKRDSFTAGGRRGPVVVPGDLAKSRLWEYVADGSMPPKKPLNEQEKRLLSAWIESGAHWGSDPIDPYRFTTEERAGYDWWSLQPVKRPALPVVRQRDRVRTPIDAFLLAQLEAKGLTFAADAAPRELIRRLYFDLWGLPPTPEEMERFAAQPSEEAYRAIVERLLAAPHYGERWARHWLDIARFGESDGFERNNPRDNLWRYRDWIIDALNQGMPYDKFARMQIAGDLLRPGTTDGLAAVGFLVSGVHNTVVGSSERMKRLARQDEVEEIVGTLGQTFLGLTVNCARCHDHKFDPIPQAEFYRLAAGLEGVAHGERVGQSEKDLSKKQQLDKDLAQLQARLAQIDEPVRRAIVDERKSGRRGPAEPPPPMSRWEFDQDYRDSVGNLHGTPQAGARLENGALVLDGRGYVETTLLTKDLTEKTLEAWVSLDDLDQRGGGVMSVQSPNGAEFDAIVYGERMARHWMAGSEFFKRTKPFEGTPETEASRIPVHIAIVYQRDGTVRGYRNGKPYGHGYQSELKAFSAGAANIVFGMRHAPPGTNKMLRGKIVRAQLYDRALSAEAVAASAGVGTDYVAENVIVSRLSSAQRTVRAAIVRDLGAIKREVAALEARANLKVYTVKPRPVGPTYMLTRGDVMTLGPNVTPGGVRALGLPADFGLADDASDRERRLKLADWVTSSANPLFARVMVNRLWHYHFGLGIVATPSDFGFNGSRPSHPALLDWLAAEFTQNQYSLKAMHRLIVLSTAYRQSARYDEFAAKLDRDNALLWRKSPQRLEAEVLRDAILHVSGKLNLEQGGPGFRDVEIRFENGTTYYNPIDPVGPTFERRTVYRFTPRGGRSSLLDTFDCPDPSATAPRRTVTTTPLQALSLLNSAFVLRMADAFAERLQREAGPDIDKQVERAFRLAFGRQPQQRELELACGLVADHGLATLCRALFNSNEFVIVD